MTTLVTPESGADVDDGPAIAELHRLHAVQRRRSWPTRTRPRRSVIVCGTGDLVDAFLPPYGPVAQAVVSSVFDGSGPTGAAAPGSV
jgi:hypothetical protein